MKRRIFEFCLHVLACLSVGGSAIWAFVEGDDKIGMAYSVAFVWCVLYILEVQYNKRLIRAFKAVLNEYERVFNKILKESAENNNSRKE